MPTTRAVVKDGGFTVVEVLLAMVLVLVVALGTTTALLGTQKQLSLARQRQWAAAVAGGALEQVRALPYATAIAGLRVDDLAGDPYVVAAGGGYRLSVPAAALGGPAGIDEPLVAAGGSSTPSPLYPHRSVPSGSSPSVFPTPPSLAVYVTANPADAGAVTLTALVRWTRPGGQAYLVVQRTRLFSPGSGSA